MAVKGLMSLLAEGMSVENLKRIGMLTDESAKKPRSVKLAQDKYKTFYENNDQFRAREEGSILNPQIVQRGLLDDRRIIMPEDIENTVLVPHKGDISGTDVTLTNIGGFELPVPVTSRGGARYPNSPLTPEGNYWASMKTGAAPFQNKAEGLMQALDMDATGVYTAMGREANYFNQAFADGMLQWAQSMKLPKEMVKKFDDDLRKSKPEWVGLDSPEARDQLLGIGNFKPEGAGKFRSAFTKKMSKAEYRDLGFPTITDIEKAFIDPDLAGTALGEAGFTMGRVGKGFDLNRNTNHPSYDTGIGGEYIGGFEKSVPPQIMYPDAYKKLEGVMTKPKSDKPPRLLYDAEKVDAIAKRKDLFQIADARWVDTVSKWLEENKGASLQAAIMAVGIPAALAPQEAEAGAAGLLNKIRAYHGSPHDFDRFSTESIGTGEGAQQYGHGLYFAEREGTAQSYRDSLKHLNSDPKIALKEAQINETFSGESLRSFTAALSDAKDKSPSQIADNIQMMSREFRSIPKEKIIDAVSRYQDKVRGRMYEVDIDVSPDELLDYDLPLSEQSEQVQNAFSFKPAPMPNFTADDVKKTLSDNPAYRYAVEGFPAAETVEKALSQANKPVLQNTGPLGAEAYNKLARELANETSDPTGAKSASEALRQSGVKGIKYADAQTRFSPKGRTSNYVIFDDAMVDIARKYGVSMPVAAGLLSGGLGTEQAQAAEYNAAPVVQEQSFGDMVNEYAQINQRAQAAEAQKFDTLMAESSNRAGMNRKQRRDNPISQGLMDYSQSQMIPNVKQVGSGFFEGLMDYAKDTMGRGYIASPSYASPQYSDINRQMMANPAQQAPLTPEQVYLDPRDPNALAKAEQARRAGQGLAGLMTLFSPI